MKKLAFCLICLAPSVAFADQKVDVAYCEATKLFLKEQAITVSQAQKLFPDLGAKPDNAILFRAKSPADPQSSTYSWTSKPVQQLKRHCLPVPKSEEPSQGKVPLDGVWNFTVTSETYSGCPQKPTQAVKGLTQPQHVIWSKPWTPDALFIGYPFKFEISKINDAHYLATATPQKMPNGEVNLRYDILANGPKSLTMDANVSVKISLGGTVVNCQGDVTLEGRLEE